MRVLYTAMLWLVLPLFLWVSGRKERKSHSTLYRFREFAGYYSNRSGDNGLMWVHAASVGEVVAVAPFINEMINDDLFTEILITTTSPTGSDRVREIYGDTVDHVYLPYDLPGATQRFLQHYKPSVGVVMETELWPNLFHQCGKQKIPLLLANVRLSQHSLEGYQRWIPKLAKQALQNVSWAAVQGQADANRLIALGINAERVTVTGSIKFDLELSGGIEKEGFTLRQQLGENRPVWIAASTREGEEAAVLQAHQRILREIPDALLILVPRHPERFNSVAKQIESKGLSYLRRSRGDGCDSDIQVYLGDSMGEMLLFYAASDLAFVGGSLVPTGSHNMLEPAALGKPVLFGPHRFNFSEISQMLIDHGAAREVADADELASLVVSLFQDRKSAREMGVQGRRVVEQNRGALKQLLTGVRRVVARQREEGNEPPD